jgi:hypothetical protein
MNLTNNILQLILKKLPEDFKRRLGVHLGVPDVGWSLMQLRRFGFAPKHALDVGAYFGDWTRTCLEVFPEVAVTCVEPQTWCQNQLIGLLGRIEKDRSPFQDQGSGSSVLLTSDTAAQSKAMTTIDALIKKGECEPPELLKLDVQGYEIEVLEGWTLGFECCQVIECELSLIPIVQGAPVLHEVVGYLYERGFVMCDVDELIRAPSDGAVWQLDALFCRVDSPIRINRSWRPDKINA